MIPQEAVRLLKANYPSAVDRELLAGFREFISQKRNTWTPDNNKLQNSLREYERYLLRYPSKLTLLASTYLLEWFEEVWYSFQEAEAFLNDSAFYFPNGNLKRVRLEDFLNRLEDPNQIELVPRAVVSAWDQTVTSNSGDELKAYIELLFDYS